MKNKIIIKGLIFVTFFLSLIADVVSGVQLNIEKENIFYNLENDIDNSTLNSKLSNTEFDYNPNVLYSSSIFSQMKPGDILQYHKPNDGVWNLFYWSHTMMYIGNDTLIHAGDPIKTVNIYTYFEKRPTIENYVILRYKWITDELAEKIVVFAQKQIDKPWDLWSILHLTKQKDTSPNHPGYGYYCTELVWASYISEGIDLDTNNIGQINPMDIYLNEKLDIIYIFNISMVNSPWERLY